jgi:lipoprotein-anchoring transpeptidase ErfK/SrfK
MAISLSRRSFVTGVAACAVLPATSHCLAAETGDDPYPLPHFDYRKLPEAFRPTVMAYTGRQQVGTVIVDTAARQLYLVVADGNCIRWGCAVGRDGFRWAGISDVVRKVIWPKWTPPEEMIERGPEKAKWKNGMPGGPDNPLGSRALYLFQNGNDTLFRIHGTTDPMSIGKNASSGCIRTINQDAVQLYRRVPVGSRVVVVAEGI